MLTLICIPLLLLGIFTFSIMIEAKADLNLLGNKNNISFFLFGHNILSIDIKFYVVESGVEIELSYKGNELDRVNLKEIKSGISKEMVVIVLPNPFYNLDIIKIDVCTVYGGGSAFSTAVMSGVVHKLVAAALAYFLSKQNIKVTNDIMPDFTQRTIIFRLTSIFFITLADIIYGVIFGKKKEKNTQSLSVKEN